MADGPRADAGDPVPARPIPTLAVPEIRDYQKINAEIVTLLDAGHPVVRLAGVGGQRLLVSSLVGSWDALIEVEGRPGPEFAAFLDAPRLKVVSLGPVADGVASGLKNGCVVILGRAGSGAGYRQSGGLVLIAGDAGPRAGLRLQAGTLRIVGDVARLSADRQAGGTFVAHALKLGPHHGRGKTGGRFVPFDSLDETNPISIEIQTRLDEMAALSPSLKMNPEFRALSLRIGPS